MGFHCFSLTVGGALPSSAAGLTLNHMEQAIPILPTEDLAVAKAFYVDGLGFRVTFEVSEDGRTGLLGLQRGTIRLTLDSPMKGQGRKAGVALEVDDAGATSAARRGVGRTHVRPARSVGQYRLCYGAATICFRFQPVTYCRSFVRRFCNVWVLSNTTSCM